MAQIGLRYPMYAPLIEDETSRTFEYGDGKVAAKAIRVDINLNVSDSPLYADDEVAERLREFIDGTITFTPDDLPAEVRKCLLDTLDEQFWMRTNEYLYQERTTLANVMAKQGVQINELPQDVVEHLQQVALKQWEEEAKRGPQAQKALQMLKTFLSELGYIQ